jgi:integrase
LTAIKQWHVYQGFLDPTQHAIVGKTLKGIQRVHGQPKTKAHALTLSELEILLQYLQIQEELAAARDKALFNVAYFAALRRSEVVNIKVAALAWSEQGVEITLTHTKTDTLNEGQVVALPFSEEVSICPATALKEWLAASGIKEGFVFCAIKKGNQLQTTPLAPAAVNFILKARALACGLPANLALSSHSFRRGMTTEASRTKSDIKQLMNLGRWKDVNTVMSYIEDAERFSESLTIRVMQQYKKK